MSYALGRIIEGYITPTSVHVKYVYWFIPSKCVQL